MDIRGVMFGARRFPVCRGHGHLKGVWRLLGSVFWLWLMGTSAWAQDMVYGPPPWPHGHPAMEGANLEYPPSTSSSGVLPTLQPLTQGRFSPGSVSAYVPPVDFVRPGVPSPSSPPSTLSNFSTAYTSSTHAPPSFAQRYSRMRQWQGASGLGNASPRSSVRGYFQALDILDGRRGGYGPSGSFTPSGSRFGQRGTSAPTFLDTYGRRKFSQTFRPTARGSLARGSFGSSKGSSIGGFSGRSSSFSSPRLFGPKLPSALTYSTPGSGVRALLRDSRRGTSGSMGSRMSMGSQGLGGGGRRGRSVRHSYSGFRRQSAGSMAYF